MMTAQKKQRPLIRYAGSVAETSIGSKPIGSEINARAYSKRHFCQASLALAHAECLSQSNAPNTAPHHAVAGMAHEQNRWPR